MILIKVELSWETEKNNNKYVSVSRKMTKSFLAEQRRSSFEDKEVSKCITGNIKKDDEHKLIQKKKKN